MSTDGIATIEIHTLDPAGPQKWAEIVLRRDYELFDLIAGGRSDPPPVPWTV